MALEDQRNFYSFVLKTLDVTLWRTRATNP